MSKYINNSGIYKFIFLENSYNKIFNFSMADLIALYKFFQCLHAIFLEFFIRNGPDLTKVIRLEDKLPLAHVVLHKSLVNQIPLLGCCIIHVFLDMCTVLILMSQLM